jgi:hypothetical protein
MDITLMTIYQVWLARNDARESKAIENPEAVARRAISLIEEWHELQAPKTVKQPAVRERWLPPEAGWTKVNSDGSMARAGGMGGGGVVIRDHEGRFLAGSCHFFPSVTDPARGS